MAGRAGQYRINRSVMTNLVAGGREGLVRGGRALLAASQATVPVDTGELRDSGRVEVEDPDRVKIGYEAPHAVAAHENTTARYRGRGRAKWLELAAHENEDAIVDAVAGRMRLP